MSQSDAPGPTAPILVTGATGNVGRHVVRRLLDAGRPVRAAAQDRASVREAFGETVEAVALDFTDPQSWDAAFSGVRQVFLLRPPHLSRPRTQMIPSLERAWSHGAEHMVLLSLQGAQRNPVVPHAALERWLRRSGLSWTFVRAAFFMQNLSTTHAADIRDRHQVVVPAGLGATAFVDAVDVAAVAAAALLAPDVHRNRVWTPTGPDALTYFDVAEILSQVLGERITYTRPGALSYFGHARRCMRMPTGMALVTTAIYTAARLGQAGGLTQDVLTVLGSGPASLRTFAERERDSWTST